MHVPSASASSANKAARPAFVLRIVFHHRRPKWNASNLVHRDVFLHHFLMSMDRDAQAVCARLLSQAGRDGAMIMNIDI